MGAVTGVIDPWFHLNNKYERIKYHLYGFRSNYTPRHDLPIMLAIFVYACWMRLYLIKNGINCQLKKLDKNSHFP